MSNFLPYDQMVEEALLGVVRSALRKAADQGLFANHHFYITFRTDFPGVEIADYLVEQYPGEMTIALQAQFWDLNVEDDYFSVALSFNRIRQILKIPFAAITAFVDPSVKFGLQFQTQHSGEVGQGITQGLGAPPTGNNPGNNPGNGGTEKKETGTGEGDEAAGEGGEVVALDAFRKKSP